MILQIKRRFSRKTKYVFLDNLRLHHTQQIKAFAHSHNVRLVFNASYSSEYNPIERLWALSKRMFSRLLISEKMADSNFQVEALVRKCILDVPAISLQRHIVSCLLKMQHHVLQAFDETRAAREVTHTTADQGSLQLKF